MDFEKYELVDVDGYSGKESRYRIPRDKLYIGQKIYEVDFFYPDGVTELTVRDIEDYVVYQDPETLDDVCRPVKAGEKPDGYSIVFGDGWSASPFEKYLTKEDAYLAAVESHESFIKDNQAMVDRWSRSINSAKERLNVIKNKLKNKEF